MTFLENHWWIISISRHFPSALSLVPPTTCGDGFGCSSSAKLLAAHHVHPGIGLKMAPKGGGGLLSVTWLIWPCSLIILPKLSQDTLVSMGLTFLCTYLLFFSRDIYKWFYLPLASLWHSFFIPIQDIHSLNKVENGAITMDIAALYLSKQD